MDTSIEATSIKQTAAVYLKWVFERMVAANQIPGKSVGLYFQAVVEVVNKATLEPNVMANLSRALAPLITPTEGTNPMFACKLEQEE